jgi:hypothetical protein
VTVPVSNQQVLSSVHQKEGKKPVPQSVTCDLLYVCYSCERFFLLSLHLQASEDEVKPIVNDRAVPAHEFSRCCVLGELIGSVLPFENSPSTLTIL